MKPLTRDKIKAITGGDLVLLRNGNGATTIPNGALANAVSALSGKGPWRDDPGDIVVTREDKDGRSVMRIVTFPE